MALGRSGDELRPALFLLRWRGFHVRGVLATAFPAGRCWCSADEGEHRADLGRVGALFWALALVRRSRWFAKMNGTQPFQKMIARGPKVSKRRGRSGRRGGTPTSAVHAVVDGRMLVVRDDSDRARRGPARSAPDLLHEEVDDLPAECFHVLPATGEQCKRAAGDRFRRPFGSSLRGCRGPSIIRSDVKGEVRFQGGRPDRSPPVPGEMVGGEGDLAPCGDDAAGRFHCWVTVNYCPFPPLGNGELSPAARFHLLGNGELACRAFHRWVTVNATPPAVSTVG